MKKIFLLVLIILMGIASYSQSISVDNGTWASKSNSLKGKYGDINYNYYGKYLNNLFGNIYAIEVNYKDSTNGKIEEIKYAISIIGDKSHFELDQDKKVLKLTDKNARLSVKGIISALDDGKKDTLASFSDIVYMYGDKRFSAWLISKDSKIGISNFSSIIKTGLYNSKNTLDFSGQKVAFFRMEKDFTLSFIAKPVSLEPTTNTSVSKK
jgi:hypothetical protein